MPPDDFRPLPLLGNPHVQTLLANLWKGPTPALAAREHLVTLPDGDRLVLHDSQPRGWRPGLPMALLVHGLGGCHASGYLVRLTARLLPLGWRVARVDLRGVGKGEPLARRTYNGACSEDVRAAALELHRASPSSPLALVGMSLGGNIVLKLAGEAAAEPLPGLAAVATVGPPVDMVRCAALIGLPRNRFYENYYVRNLVRQVRRHWRHFADLPRVRFPRGMTLRQFDDLCTAPRGGFADAQDYYRRASSLPLIPRIQVPTLILTARDDPFIAVESFEHLKAPGHVEVRVLDRGGHLGFLGWDGAGGVRWAERRVLEWLTVTVGGHSP